MQATGLLRESVIDGDLGARHEVVSLQRHQPCLHRIIQLSKKFRCVCNSKCARTHRLHTLSPIFNFVQYEAGGFQHSRLYGK